MSEFNPLSLFLKDRETKSGDLVPIEEIRKQKIQRRVLLEEEKKARANEWSRKNQLQWIEKKKEQGQHTMTIYPLKSNVAMIDEFREGKFINSKPWSRTDAFDYIVSEYFNNQNNNNKDE